MQMQIERWQFIHRSQVQANRDKIFLFGDNLAQIGYGGQARQMRGEPNTVGIPTKKWPSMIDDAFLSDDDYETNIWLIQQQFNKLRGATCVVIAADGLGEGLAELPQRAPRTLQFIIEQI